MLPAACEERLPTGRNPYGWHIAEGRADIFLAYCTATRDAQKENPGLQMIALPDALAVSADYALTVMADASPGAYQFALFILSPEGQRILVRRQAFLNRVFLSSVPMRISARKPGIAITLFRG